MIKIRASDRLGDESRPGWRQLLLFPEGTTTNGRCLIKFKTGAFEVNGIKMFSFLSIRAIYVTMQCQHEWSFAFFSSLACRSKWFWSARSTLTISTHSRGLGTRLPKIPWCSCGWQCVSSTQILRYLTCVVISNTPSYKHQPPNKVFVKIMISVLDRKKGHLHRVI